MVKLGWTNDKHYSTETLHRYAAIISKLFGKKLTSLDLSANASFIYVSCDAYRIALALIRLFVEINIHRTTNLSNHHVFVYSELCVKLSGLQAGIFHMLNMLNYGSLN